MTTIAHLETGHYRIEPPVKLSGSTHGTMTHFGKAIAPRRPGHGITFDRTGLERTRA